MLGTRDGVLETKALGQEFVDVLELVLWGGEDGEGIAWLREEEVDLVGVLDAFSLSE